MPAPVNPRNPPAPLNPVATLRVELATVGELAGARRGLYGWVLSNGVGIEIAQDLSLAAYEAMANAVEHAYPDQRGRVTLTAHHDQDELVIEVRDWGRWRSPPADPGWRGRGLTVIAAVCDDLDVDPRPPAARRSGCAGSWLPSRPTGGRRCARRYGSRSRVG